MPDEAPGSGEGASASTRRPAGTLGEPSSETEASKAAGACIAALVEELEALAAEDQGLESFLSALRRVDPRRDRPGGPKRGERPVSHSIGRALSRISPEWSLGKAVSRVAPLLDWHPVFRSRDIDPHLTRNLQSAELANRRDGPDSRPLFVGLFLLAPHTRYPLHSHTAPEVYYCVSGRLTLQHGIDGEPFPLLPGEYSITPSERLHALTTNDEPVLLFYIWLPRPESENWWWAQEPDGSWRRDAWQWQSDGRWVRIGSEAVDAETMHKGASQYCAASPAAAG